MDRILFRIGNIEIAWYSVLIAIGAITAIYLIIKEGKKFGDYSDFLFNLCFWTILFGILGARLYYVLFNLKYYRNFWDIFKIWEGGLAIHGGIIAGLITIIIYCKKYKRKPLIIFDYIAPALLLAQAIGRWGNFFNGEAHGPVTTLAHLKELYIPDFIIKGMNINGIYYEPTFYYESLWCLLGVLVMLILRRMKITKNGQIFATYLMWYGIGRFYIESLRTDSLMLGNLKAAQIVSIVMIIIGVITTIITMKKESSYLNHNDSDLKY